MINPDFLKTFQSLAETRHFTRTAQQLNMTQPGVSQHLKKLESYFETTLIQREGSAIHLTDAGRELKTYIEQCFRDFESLNKKIKTDDPFEGHSRFASPGSLGLILFDTMIELTKKHSKLRLDLIVAPRMDIAGKLLNDEIDIGYGASAALDPRINNDFFYEEPLCVVVPASFKGKSFNSFCELGIVWHPDLPYLVERVFSKNFKQYRGMKDFPIRTSINQFNRILDPVEAGVGWTILPSVATHYFSSLRKAKAIYLKECVSEKIYRMTLKNKKLPERIKIVEARFKEALKNTP